jgi:hypothetical protein
LVCCFAVLTAWCRQPPAESSQPRTLAAPDGGVVGTSGSNPHPSAAECESLWSRYREQAPNDPFVSHAWFVARCQQSDRAVLTCPERVRAELLAMLRQSREAEDAGVNAGAEPGEESALLRFGMPSRHGICMARERVRFALRSGELRELERRVAGGSLQPGQHGVVVVKGTSATLPSVGFVEIGHHFEMAPVGELRAFKKPDGRVWIYVLGALLGRHQNQVGFLHSSGPFVPGDFRRSDEGESICLEPESDEGSRPQRYMLTCFQVISRLAPELLEIGAAPA